MPDHVVVLLLTEHVVLSMWPKRALLIGLDIWGLGHRGISKLIICFPCVLSVKLESAKARFSAVKNLDSDANGFLTGLSFAVLVTSANCEFIIQEIMFIVACWSEDIGARFIVHDFYYGLINAVIKRKRWNIDNFLDRGQIIFLPDARVLWYTWTDSVRKWLRLGV